LLGFGESSDNDNTRITDNEFDKFQKIWAEYDEEGTGFILADDLEKIVLKLCKEKSSFFKYPELLIKKSKERLALIEELALPVYKQFRYYAYFDAISSLSKEVFRRDFKKD
jgi:hypothetical protein